jgi:hypothetical protein
VGGDFEEGADTVGGRNTHSSDGGAGSQYSLKALFYLDSLYSPLTDVGRDEELDMVLDGVYLVATRH